jgi:hypothetical protein
MSRTRLGDIIQLAGLIFLGAGIGFEMATQADIGYIYISIGSVVFAVGCKLKGK